MKFKDFLAEEHLELDGDNSEFICEADSEYVTLTQDNKDKLNVKIPRADIESALGSVTKWKPTKKYETLLSRLYACNSSEFDDVVGKLHVKYGNE